MAIEIEVPRLSYEQIRKYADEFLSRFHPTGSVPIPIEGIVEFSLGINIVPIPGIQRALEVEGFISSDFKSISVDQSVMERFETRYRFSLAHEIGHFCLHKEVFGRFDFATVEGWKRFQTEISEKDYGWLEWQAYSFGGLVLVPREQLASRLAICREQIAQVGLDPNTEPAQLRISVALGREFNVSKSVIDKRLQCDTRGRL